MNYRSYRLNEAAAHVCELGYHPIFTALHGSQNYGLDVYTDEYQSDLDYVCVVVPTLRDLVKNTSPASFTVSFEGGQIDVKDIRAFVDTVCKMNPAYLETLLTPLCITHPLAEPMIKVMRSCIPAMLNEMGLLFIKAICGTYKDKERALTHPAPSSEEKILRYGYDGKQAHHMYRLLLMLKGFSQTGRMLLAPPSYEKDLLIRLKLNRLSLGEVLRMTPAWREEIEAVAEETKARYAEVRAEAKQRVIRYAQEIVYQFCLTDEGRN